MARMINFNRMNMRKIGEDPSIQERFNAKDDGVGTCCYMEFDEIPTQEDVNRSCSETGLQFFLNGKDAEYTVSEEPRINGSWGVLVLNGLITKSDIRIE